MGKSGAARSPIPRTVWALGLVGMFMDISSEIKRRTNLNDSGSDYIFME